MPDSPASRRQHNPDIICETEHLAGAVANGMALRFAPFEKKTVTFHVVAFSTEGRLQRITPDGDVQWQSVTMDDQRSANNEKE